MKYTSRGLRRRRNSDQWECTLSHKDPLTGDTVRSFHTIVAKTQRQAERARDELILELERKGGAVGTKVTVREFIESYLFCKEASRTVEKSTMEDYRKCAKVISKYLGDTRLSDLSIPDVNNWMSAMSDEGYAPRTISKPFRLLKQALNFAMAQDLLTKNPCMFCKPPKNYKKKINSLNREERSRMLDLARAAQPDPLGVAIELALTTDMRRGEICRLRWSDLGEDQTISVRRAVASYLGHASVSMTLNTYADVDPEAKIAAVGKIDAAFDTKHERADVIRQESNSNDELLAKLAKVLNPEHLAQVISLLDGYNGMHD